MSDDCVDRDNEDLRNADGRCNAFDWGMAWEVFDPTRIES